MGLIPKGDFGFDLTGMPMDAEKRNNNNPNHIWARDRSSNLRNLFHLEFTQQEIHGSAQVGKPTEDGQRRENTSDV